MKPENGLTGKCPNYSNRARATLMNARGASVNTPKWLEGECAKIIRRHPAIFWISVDLRVPHWAFWGTRHEETKVQTATEMLLLKTALFYKHGTDEIDGMEHYVDGSFGFAITKDDVIDLFGGLYALLGEIINLQPIYRRVNKGAELTIESKRGELDTFQDAESTEYMQLYDRRRRKHSTTFSPIGFFASFPAKYVQPSRELEDDRWSTLSFALNLDATMEHTIPEKGRIKPAFRPALVGLESLDFIQVFERRVEIVTGLSLLQLRLGLVALKNYLCKRWSDPGLQYTFMSRGVIFANSSFLRKKLAAHLTELFAEENESRNSAEAVGVFLHLLSSKEKLQNYDVLLRQGCGCLHAINNLLTLDLSLILLLLSDLNMDIQLDSEMRQIKGSQFENRVFAQLSTDCPGVSFPIKPGLKLRKVDKQNSFAEVDLYIQSGNLLFLVDCKAWSLTREYFRGDRRDVENRWELVRQWLMKTDKRAREIAKTPIGSNFKIPTDVTHLIPVVCSACPEFFWNLDDSHYLVPRRVPRVCTYGELVEILNGPDVSDLRHRPFAIKVMR